MRLGRAILITAIILFAGILTGCHKEEETKIEDVGSFMGSISIVFDELTDTDRYFMAYKKFTHNMYIKLNEAKDLRYRKEYRKRDYPTLYYGNPKIKAVALTFDDGPHPWSTLKLLAILKKYKVRATFFVVGKMAQQYPQLLKAIYEDGHLIANHTYSHVNLLKLTPQQIEDEWRKCNNTIRVVLGIRTYYCRPPGGNYDWVVLDAAMRKGLTPVLWTDDPGDYAQPGEKAIMQKFEDYMENGAIILLHDGPQQTLNVLPKIIESLKKRGYKFQTVDEMARELYEK